MPLWEKRRTILSSLNDTNNTTKCNKRNIFRILEGVLNLIIDHFNLSSKFYISLDINITLRQPDVYSLFCDLFVLFISTFIMARTTDKYSS